MWKNLAKEIKKNIFLHARDVNSLHNPKIITWGIKSRPTDEDGIYKTNKMYQMRVGDIKPVILEWVKRTKADHVQARDLPEALGIDDRMVFFNADEITKYLIYNNGYFNYDKGWDNDWNNDDAYIEFALFSEMKLIEKNAKEKAILEQKSLTQRKISFNSLVVRDNLIEAFKKAGYSLTTYDDGHTFRIDLGYNYSSGSYENPQDYNKFIEDAIDYYINNFIAKDLGCRVHIPKPSSRKGIREAYDNLIDMEHIDIEGECNG